jgi:hypothetical protein
MPRYDRNQVALRPECVSRRCGKKKGGHVRPPPGQPLAVSQDVEERCMHRSLPCKAIPYTSTPSLSILFCFCPPD